MTKSLEIAIERLKQMPEEQQESIAQLVLHELDEDERWAHSSAVHSEKLNQLVSEVLEANRRGECEALDPESL
jgi:hypothetical protein